MKNAKLFESLIFFDPIDGVGVGDDKGAVAHSETSAVIPEFGRVFEVVCANSDDAGSHLSDLGHQFIFSRKRARPSRLSSCEESRQEYVKQRTEAYDRSPAKII